MKAKESTAPPSRKPLSKQVEECTFSFFKEAVCASVYESDAVAMGTVGSMYFSGYGCERDPDEAAKWLYQACIRGAIMPDSYKMPEQPLPAPAVLKDLPPPPPLSSQQSSGSQKQSESKGR